jgi:hypothetical protein
MPTPLNQTLIGPASILFGTCEVSQAYGVVKSCKEKDTADEQKFLDCRGNTRAVLLTDERIELQLEVVFDDGNTVDLGDDIAFPESGVTGQVTEAEIAWEQNGEKGYTITAKHWKSLGSTPTVTHLSVA